MRKANLNNPPNNDYRNNQHQSKYNNQTKDKDDANSSSQKNNGQTNWRNKLHDKSIFNHNKQSGNHFNIKQKNQAHGNYRNKKKDDNVDQINISGKFNIKLLTDLSNEDSDVLISKLVKDKVEFEKFLWDIPLELIPLTLKVLANICNANFTEFLSVILIPACSNKLLGKLEVYLLKLAYEKEIDKIKNKLYYDDVNKFWSDLTIFFRRAIEILPTKAYVELRSILEKLNMIFDTIERFQDSYNIDKKIKESALNLFEQLETERKRNEEKNKASAKPSISIELEDENPPDNFRNLGIIPTIDDLIDDKPFIRKCKITEPYNSVDHYLDVQFRLLREDFICPLRNGINEYLNAKSSKNRNHDLRVYREVTLLTPEVNDNTVGITVCFKKLQNINWNQSKRFMFGSLLLLSKDNFNNILFVTVANRDEKALARGCILVEPCEGTVITQAMYNTKFVMLESKIYFEPYWAVLNAMKRMNERNFPMEDYLISANSLIRLPQYLPQEALLTYKGLKLPVAYDQSWPDAKKLKLDETQLNAFRSALTQEFSLIQGPPGTGKTFIALEIVGALLENDKHWKKYGPIVVVCLTNHALDQFLEGILKYTKSVVRIGSRSKNEALKPYTLVERRKFTKGSRGSAASFAFHDTKSNYEQILKKIAALYLDIQYLTTPKAIVPVNLLKRYNNDFILNELNSNEELINWLIELNNISSNFNVLSKYDESQEYASETLAKDNDQVENVLKFDERYHERRMDDELEIDYLFQVDKSYKLFYPIEAINYLMLDVKQKIHEYSKEMIAEGYSPTELQLPMEFQKHLDILKNNKLFLQEEFSKHPLLNRNGTPSENPDWEIYWNWVGLSYEYAIKELAELEDEYYQVRSQLNEAKQLVDLAVLKEHKVVGLTTTGAAKLFSSLRALHSPIVLVEEAAEILESHVVCSLTKHCQQVILIGDHKQLQPKASVYKLGKDYNLNISLFERMVRIRGDCAQLAYQHRMRPLFARLLTPSIYQKLYNHKSVFEYPPVKGLTKSLFFLNHSHREETYDNEDSWVNKHEVELLISFARHLILQGYDSSEITVLCTYTGQLFALTKERDRHFPILQGLRVTTVDNFQGEENKIILLSLVRNNGEGNIGFLKEENRVCVALSRAREGLYIMGNIEDLVVKNSIWPKIKNVLEENQAIGDVLQLRCQIHSDQFIKIKHVDDFRKCIEGGCSKMCGVDMPCGHLCLSVCHMCDREHKEFACRQPCLKACPFNHPCPLPCHEGCKPCIVKVERELSCGHTVKMSCSSDPKTYPCYIQVETTLPDCNHQIQKSCYRDVKSCGCTHPCDSRLPCGHTCKLTCHVNKDPDHIEYKCKKDCAKTYAGCENNHQCKKKCFEECGLCPIRVEKIRSCGHFYKQAQCGEDLEKQPCIRSCKRDIPSCGHKCKQRCSDPCGNCQIMVDKISASCNHKVKVKCCEEATSSRCTGQCPKILPCGHPCTEKCKDRCTIACQFMVNLDQPGQCGHIFKVPCFLRKTDPKSEVLMQYCKEPCGTELECKHFCNGNCGDCMQGRIHSFCSEACGFSLVCGHECNEPCREACKPCKKKCEIQCFHNKCKQKCGIPCAPCKEPCVLGCEHKKCTKRCSELCNIEPCTEPCKKKLKCGHLCVGFCGDPCPPLCRICDKEELTTFKLCREDEPDARFVVLESCGHCIESNDLSDWLQVDNELIQVKRCPLDYCKKPIHNCARLTNQIKTNWRKVLRVKEKVFCGNYKDLRGTQLKHLKTIQKLQTDPVSKAHPKIREFLEDLHKRTTFVNRKQRKQILSAQENDACRAVLDVVHAMYDILSLIKVSDITRKVKSYENVLLQVSMILNAVPSTWHFPKQRINDIQFELLRLEYMIKVCNLEFKSQNSIGLVQQKEFEDVMAMLKRCKRFDEKLQAEIFEKINSLQVETIKRVEVRLIVEAMNLKSGHWYECPNGHPYAIGECGGAMQVAKCFCGASIGGTQHRLLSDNRVSTKMN